MIKMILAVGKNNELGSNSTTDGLPWTVRNEEDLKYFKDCTLGKTVVYGKNTYKSFLLLGMEDGLPQRVNWVLSNDVNPLSKRGYITAGTNTKLVNRAWLTSWMELLRSTEDIWIIGGKSIYEQFHHCVDEVHLTRINQEFPDADVHINLDFLSYFDKVEESQLNEYSHVEVWVQKR